MQTLVRLYHTEMALKMFLKSQVLLWFSVACFGVRVSLTFHLMCFHIIFSSVLVAEWPPFGKELLTRLTMCYFYILAICNFSYFPFWF